MRSSACAPQAKPFLEHKSTDQNRFEPKHVNGFGSPVTGAGQQVFPIVHCCPPTSHDIRTIGISGLRTLDGHRAGIMQNLKENKVSICIPTRNRPHLLRNMLDTIFSQTYDNYEIIITDNSDNDESRYLVESCADSRISYHKNEKNLGMDGNARRAFSFVSGEFFTFTADDDLWEPDNLRRKVNFLRRVPQVDTCFSNAKHILMDGSPHPHPFQTTYRDGVEAIADPYYLNPISLHFPPDTPLFVNTLTGVYRTVEYLPLLIEFWECGSEEYAQWYLGLSGRQFGFLFDPLIIIRDGDHNWEIQTEGNTLTNYRKSPETRAAQLNKIYTTLHEKHGPELKMVDKKTELVIFTFLVEQIGQEAVKYIKNFPLINVQDFNNYIIERNKILKNGKTFP
ncbi:glycosyltransferase family 2 protein (plasmid) [Azospirillum sp. A26]|uniref:glycosyltransferase family 2 protein n=1 Tax=Azospirillum sp. A26 TaxID=3160607 RepID=UPI00366D208A